MFGIIAELIDGFEVMLKAGNALSIFDLSKVKLKFTK